MDFIQQSSVQIWQHQQEVDFINNYSSYLQGLLQDIGELMENVDDYEHRLAGGLRRTQDTRNKLCSRVVSFISKVEAAYLIATPVEERDAKFLFTFNHLKNAQSIAELQDDDGEVQFQSDEDASTHCAELDEMTSSNFPQEVEDVKQCILDGFANRLPLYVIMEQVNTFFSAMD